MFTQPANVEEWDRYRFTDEQVAFYNEHGYLAGIRLLDEAQIEQLRAELDQLLDPENDARHLCYEYHSNEATDPATILFHALGAWRAAPGFHDLL